MNAPSDQPEIRQRVIPFPFQLPPDFRIAIRDATRDYAAVVSTNVETPPPGLNQNAEHFYDVGARMPTRWTGTNPLRIFGGPQTPSAPAGLTLQFHCSNDNPIWTAGSYSGPGQCYWFTDPMDSAKRIYFVCEWNTANHLVKFTWIVQSSTAPSLLWSGSPHFPDGIDLNYVTTPPTGTTWWHITLNA